MKLNRSGLLMPLRFFCVGTLCPTSADVGTLWGAGVYPCHNPRFGLPTKERDRMRRYMDSLQFNDGTTALERFEEQEQQLHQKLNRDLQR